MTETDSEFEAFLKRRTVLPNGMSDDDKLEPPKALDAIVLKKAREAIRAQERVNRAPRWATPVALAATILLCLSIVLNVSLNTNRPTAGLRRMTAATADKASPTPAAPASADERREGAGDGTVSHEATLPEAKVAESYAPRSPVLEARVYTDTAAAHAPATLAREAAASSASGTATNAPARSAATPATPTPSVMASAAPPPPSPAPAMPSSSAGVPADQFTSVTVTGARRSRADERTAASYPSTSGSAPSSAAAGTLAADADADATASGLEGASHATPGRSREGRPGPTPSGRMPAQEEAVVTKRQAAAAPHPKDPKIWLQQIAALRAEGKAAQADAEMQRFRAIFPKYPEKPGPSTPSEPPQ